ncbi:MAG: AraC family transcriptional regulator [Pedobacter sp.]|nr:AraC family transcriptional regulator [Pedobacter sp.]
MPLVSSWPLAAGSQRYVIPAFARQLLAADRRSRDCYPEAMGFYGHAAGHAMQRSPAEHEEHLLLYCVQGHASLEVSGEVQALQPGMLAVLPAAVAHAYHADSHDPWSLYWVHLNGEAVQDFLAPLLEDRPWAVLAPGLSPGLLADWRSLLEAGTPGFEPAALQLAAARLRQLLVHLAWLGSRSPQARSRLDVTALQLFMQQHLQESLSLEQLAAVAGMEKFHFAKTFRRLTGQAPLQHFQHLRMARACEWLDAGEEGIAVIAQRLGYGDAPYFSRQFRQVTGMSPSEYRALKRG